MTLSTAAGLLPVLLWLLAAVGMLWADVSFAERLGGLGKFHRLLLIPLLLMQFRRSERGMWVLYGVLCFRGRALLASWGLATCRDLPWRGTHRCRRPGQGSHFPEHGLSGLRVRHAWLRLRRARERRWRWTAGACGALGPCFSRQYLSHRHEPHRALVAPLLLLLLGWREFRWKGLLGTALIGCIVGAGRVVRVALPARARLRGSIDEYQAYRATDVPNSTGLHSSFCGSRCRSSNRRRSSGMAPVRSTHCFATPAPTKPALRGTLTQNPHNQIFAVAIQLGLAAPSCYWRCGSRI